MTSVSTVSLRKFVPCETTKWFDWFIGNLHGDGRLRIFNPKIANRFSFSKPFELVFPDRDPSFAKFRHITELSDGELVELKQGLEELERVWKVVDELLNGDIDLRETEIAELLANVGLVDRVDRAMTATERLRRRVLIVLETEGWILAHQKGNDEIDTLSMEEDAFADHIYDLFCEHSEKLMAKMFLKGYVAQ